MIIILIFHRVMKVLIPLQCSYKNERSVPFLCKKKFFRCHFIVKIIKIAKSKYDIRILKLKITDPIWPKLQSRWIFKKMYTLMFLRLLNTNMIKFCY